MVTMAGWVVTYVGAFSASTPVQKSQLPNQLGCWLICQTPVSQKRPWLVGSALNLHFCASARVSTPRPVTMAATEMTLSARPSGGRALRGTPAAAVCGKEHTKPQINEDPQKPAAPFVVERVWSSRASWCVCSTR